MYRAAPSMRKDLGTANLAAALGFELPFQHPDARVEVGSILKPLDRDRTLGPLDFEHVFVLH